MRPAVPDRALRRLVAELAALRETDIEAVLTELDEVKQMTVRRLLESYRGVEPPASSHSGDRVVIDVAGLSPWLAVRLHAAAVGDAHVEAGGEAWEGRPGPMFEMTPLAMQALLSAAVENKSASVAAAPPATSDWFTRALSTFLGRGVPA